jgi:D-tyrosyl-tRNA(Tyr) deacylase
MRIVLQRAKESSVEVEGRVTGQIVSGLVVFLGIGKEDTPADAEYLVDKILGLRIFEDPQGKMNFNVKDTQGSLLVISQFTLYGDVRKGRRPSFDQAAPAPEARVLYEYFIQTARARGVAVETGVFQASMTVRLVNDGPVTILCDSIDRK